MLSIWWTGKNTYHGNNLWVLMKKKVFFSIFFSFLFCVCLNKSVALLFFMNFHHFILLLLFCRFCLQYFFSLLLFICTFICTIWKWDQIYDGFSLALSIKLQPFAHACIHAYKVVLLCIQLQPVNVNFKGKCYKVHACNAQKLTQKAYKGRMPCTYKRSKMIVIQTALLFEATKFNYFFFFLLCNAPPPNTMMKYGTRKLLFCLFVFFLCMQVCMHACLHRELQHCLQVLFYMRMLKVLCSLKYSQGDFYEAEKDLVTISYEICVVDFLVLRKVLELDFKVDLWLVHWGK